MKKTLADLAKLTNAEVKGDRSCLITGIATLQDAKAGDITFLHNKKYKKFLTSTKASAVILSPDEVESCTTNALVTKDPYFTYAKIASLIQYKMPFESGIHSTAVIGNNCKIDPSANISANAVIGDYVEIGANTTIGAGAVIEPFCEIGESCQIHANVTLHHHVKIANRVVLCSGVVLGEDGFGNTMHEGRWYNVPQLGTVIVEDDVNIGANTTVDRGSLGDTIIGKGARLDNLIQVGHNVEIGDYTAIAACTAIAGSVKIGKYCLIGGAATISGHIEIADRTILTGMTAVAHSINEPGIYSSGMPANKNSIWRKNIVRFQKLDKMAKRLRQLELKISEGEKND